jgi:hypothetical protein
MKELLFIIVIIVILGLLSTKEDGSLVKLKCNSQVKQGEVAIQLSDERNEPGCPGYVGKNRDDNDNKNSK